MLAEGISKVLYAPTTGTVNPWQLGIAAWENAMQNGAELLLNTEVLGIRRTENGYLVETGEDAYTCNMVFNCAGLSADKVQELLFPPSVRLDLDGAEYLVFDELAPKPERIIFHQADRCGKGITAIPCVEGNLLLESPSHPQDIPFATTREGMAFTREAARQLLPALDTDAVIRSFGAVRPNPHKGDGSSIHDFCIEQPSPTFISFIGIKTPGLTCANELGLLLAQKAAAYLQAQENSTFDPSRKGITEKDNEIICQCEQITRAEILEAIRRGATTVDGVKRRTNAGMGRCQGGFCGPKVLEILHRELGMDPTQVLQDQPGSYIIASVKGGSHE